MKKPPYRIMPLMFVLGSTVLALATYPAKAQRTDVEFVNAFPKLEFTQPLYFGHADDGSDYVYVGEYAGVVKVFEARPDVTPEEVRVYLDLSDRTTEFYGIAFHPEYEDNGYVYVSYLTTGEPMRSMLVRYTRSPDDPLAVDPTSEVVLLELEQPALEHNGGTVLFGHDGYLYLSLGDGDCCGDPHGNGQDPTTLFSSIIRVDVDNPSGGLNYGIPPDNPFVGNTEGWREEIYAYGFRNPWRFSFDRATGDLWVGDVGSETWEEVDLVEAGQNYGWSIMEGPDCFNDDSCDQTGLELPIYAYGHEEGRSISGGYVYRGNQMPELNGYYIYGDWGSNRIWALDVRDLDNVVNAELIPPEGTSTVGWVASFGEGPDGELYYTAIFRG